MQKKDYFIVAFSALLLLVFIYLASYYNWTRYAMGDTALYAQVTSNIAKTGKGEGQILANTQDYIDRHISAIPISERMSDDSSYAIPEDQSRNLMKYHAHFILFLLAPFTYILSAYQVVTLAQSISLACSIFFVILILREYKIKWSIVALSVLLVISHPGWSVQALCGPFYPERIFLGTGLYLAWSLEKRKFSKAHFLIASFLCIITNERGALYAGCFILAYTFFYWKDNDTWRAGKIITGVIALGYSIVMMFFYLDNSYYQSSGGGFGGLLEYLSTKTTLDLIKLFVVINIFLFLIIAIADIRAFVIAICSCVPNIVYNVGGSEKIGWILHYHIFYFVVLIWALLRGVIAFEKGESWIQNFSFHHATVIRNVLLVCLIIGINCIDSSNVNLRFDVQNIKNNIFISGANEINNYYILGNKKSRIELTDFFQTNIPGGAKVSTVEGAMYALTDCEIYVYPLGIISEAEYVVIPYCEVNGKYHYKGSFTYYGTDETEKYDEYLSERLKILGFEVDNPLVYSPYSIAIVKREKE